MKKEYCNPVSDSMQCIDEIRLLRYALEDIHPDEKKRVEAHLMHCNACLLKVQESVFIQAMLNESPDMEVPPELIEQVNQKWKKDEVQSAAAASVPHLILQLAAKGMKILQESFLPQDIHTEWNIFAAPAFVSRGSEKKNPEEQELLLTQTVKDKNISVLLSIRKDGQESVRLCVMLKKSSIPFTDKRIFLKRDGATVRSKKTDAQGSAVFPEIPIGNYIIRIPSDDIEWSVDIIA